MIEIGYSGQYFSGYNNSQDYSSYDMGLSIYPLLNIRFLINDRLSLGPVMGYKIIRRIFYDGFHVIPFGDNYAWVMKFYFGVGTTVYF